MPKRFRLRRLCVLFDAVEAFPRLFRWPLHSGTSIGANLEEADGGESKPDFRHKVGVARKEAKESRYWLRLIAYAERRVQESASPLIEESTQLVAILTTIRKNAESSSHRG